MDWILLLKIAGAIACVVGLYYLVQYVQVFWQIAEAVCKFIEYGIQFITYPFNDIKEWIKEQNKKHLYSGDAIGRFADRHPTIGTERSIKFFIVAVIYLIIVFTVRILNADMGDFIQNLFDAYPLIYVIKTFAGDNSFTVVGAISTGISALLMSAFFTFCMGDFKRKGHFLRWLISIPYYIVTTLLGCYFGMVLSNVWNWMANIGVNLFNSFKAALNADSKTLLGILIIVGSFIAMVLLLYVGLILLLTALKEYMDVFIYGLIGLLFIIVCVLLMFIWGGQDFITTATGNTILTISSILAFFATDFMRVNKGELLGTDSF